MQYNSSKKTLVIPEYGRHIQRLIDHIKTVENKEKRSELAEGVVKLMLQMNPVEKKSSEYVDKMWTHLLKIGNYELDIDIPDYVDIDKEPKEIKPEKIDYPPGIPNYRHYGMYIQKLLDKAMEMPDSPERNDFVRIIGSYMKTAYKQWNKDHFVNDESVLEDISIITKGELSISDDQSLDYLKSSYQNNRNNRKSRSSRNSNNNRKSKGGSNNRNFRKRK